MVTVMFNVSLSFIFKCLEGEEEIKACLQKTQDTFSELLCVPVRQLSWTATVKGTSRFKKKRVIWGCVSVSNLDMLLGDLFAIRLLFNILLLIIT